MKTFKELFGQNESILKVVETTLNKNLAEYEKTQSVANEKQYSQSQVQKIVKDSLNIQNKVIAGSFNLEREEKRNLCIVQGGVKLHYTDNDRRCGKKLVEVVDSDVKDESSRENLIEKRSLVPKKAIQESLDQK